MSSKLEYATIYKISSCTYEGHSTIRLSYLRIPSWHINKNTGWALKIANRGINGSSNTVSAILIWPAATRQSWHYPPQLESVSSGGEPRQFGNIEVDNYSSIIRSSTVTFAIIIKVQSFLDGLRQRISVSSRRQLQLRIVSGQGRIRTRNQLSNHTDYQCRTYIRNM
jgi:hypothetical protein